MEISINVDEKLKSLLPPSVNTRRIQIPKNIIIKYDALCINDIVLIIKNLDKQNVLKSLNNYRENVQNIAKTLSNFILLYCKYFKL